MKEIITGTFVLSVIMLMLVACSESNNPSSQVASEFLVQITKYRDKSSLGSINVISPYFRILVKYNSDSPVSESDPFIGEDSLINPYSHKFELPRYTEQFTIAVMVIATGIPGDELALIDYTPDESTKADTISLNINDLPVYRAYDGSDDGQIEMDCGLEFSVTLN